MEPPAELLMPLLPYQKQFLAWAIKQERGTVKGGILADEVREWEGHGRLLPLSDGTVSWWDGPVN